MRSRIALRFCSCRSLPAREVASARSPAGVSRRLDHDSTLPLSRRFAAVLRHDGRQRVERCHLFERCAVVAIGVEHAQEPRDRSIRDAAAQAVRRHRPRRSRPAPARGNTSRCGACPATRRDMSSREKRRLSFQHGWRGCDTCTIAVPMRNTSPTQTSFSSMPRVDRFSPNAPGVSKRSRTGWRRRSILRASVA